MFCVYKYVYNNEPVYIGSTQNLETRIKQHSEETKLFGITEVYYFLCDSKEQMIANEKYYIKHFSPALNHHYNKLTNDELSLIIYEPNWIKYPNKINYTLPYIDFTKVKEQNQKINTVPNQRTILIRKNSRDETQKIYLNRAGFEQALKFKNIGALKLYLYLSSNNNGYQFALSRSYFKTLTNCADTAYRSGFKELVEKGYLIETRPNYFTFRDIIN